MTFTFGAVKQGTGNLIAGIDVPPRNVGDSIEVTVITPAAPATATVRNASSGADWTLSVEVPGIVRVLTKAVTQTVTSGGTISVDLTAPVPYIAFCQIVSEGATNPPEPSTAFDLIVTALGLVDASVAAGGAVRPTATVKNQGGTAIPSGTIVGVGFQVNGAATVYSDSYTAGLAPGASQTVQANGGGTSGTFPRPSGSFTLAATVDDVNRFPNEDSETNNTFSVTVPAALPALSGVAVASGGKTDADTFATWRGSPVTVVSDYWGTATWTSMSNATWTADRHSGRNYLANWAIPLRPRDNTGEPADKTATFQAIARQLITNGQASCIVRLGWEMNGDWFPWAATLGVAQWISEYRAAVAAMRSVPGTNFTFEFCVANRTVVNTPAACWPGDDVVDCVSADVYDWSWAAGYTDPVTRWNDITAGAWGLNAIYQLSLDHGKKFGIPEWGLAFRTDGHGGGDDPAFIAKLRAWIDARKVWYENYFEKNDSSDVRFKMMSSDFPNASSTYRSTWFGKGGAATTNPVTGFVTRNTSWSKNGN